MARVGLEPGYEGGYFQPVSLLAVSLDADQPPALTWPSRASRWACSMGGDIVYWSKLNASDITVEDSELVFVGYGVVAPEYGWDDYAGLDVEGRTVVMLVNDPGYARSGQRPLQWQRHDLLRPLDLQV